MTKDDTIEPVEPPFKAEKQTDEEARLMLETQKDAARHRESEGGYQ